MEITEEYYEERPPKKSAAIKKVLNIMFDILFAAVLILLFSFLLIAVQKGHTNRPPELFGNMYVRVASGSMRESGFNVGDVVCVKTCKISELKEGDIITFYYCAIDPEHLEEKDDFNDFETGRRTFKSSIIFHKIADIKVDDDGYAWVLTYGTSNKDAYGDPIYDGWTRTDYILGKYKPDTFAKIMQFFTNGTVFIFIVLIPCGITLFTLLVKIIQTTDQMITEKKIAEGYTKAKKSKTKLKEIDEDEKLE